MIDSEERTAGDEIEAMLDPLGRPLSPVSVAGMHRRTRRRERRGTL